MRLDVRIELRDGRSVRFYGHPFNARRWRGSGAGLGREGNGRDRWRRLLMYEWPFGIIHVTDKWGSA